MKFSFIARHRGTRAVDWMCGAPGVSRGGFYAWLTRPRSRRSRLDEELGGKVRASLIGSDRTYGARPVWRELLAEGFRCGLPSLPDKARPAMIDAEGNALTDSSDDAVPKRAPFSLKLLLVLVVALLGACLVMMIF